MSHMKRFGNIGSAVINDEFRCMTGLLHTKLFLMQHFNNILSDKLFADLYIQESGFNRFHRLKHFIFLQFCCNFISDHKRSFMVFLRTRHRAIALVLTQIRPVRQCNTPKPGIISCCRKCIRYFL